MTPDFDAARISPRMKQYEAAQAAATKQPTLPQLEREGFAGCAIIAFVVVVLALAVAWIVVGSS